MDGSLSESEYLVEVSKATGLAMARFASFGETINRTWATTSELFNALTLEGAGTAYDATLEAIEKLTPPEQFKDDHQRLLQGLQGLAATDKKIGEAIANNDLEGFILSNAMLGEMTVLIGLDLSREVCRAARGTVN